MDVDSSQSVESGMKMLNKFTQKIDLLFNNAGI